MAEGGGVGFEGDVGVFQGKDVVQAFKKLGEVARGKHRGGAAAEVEGGDGVVGFAAGCGCCFSLCEDGADEGAFVCFARGVFVERAVGADPVAERNVDVDDQ